MSIDDVREQFDIPRLEAFNRYSEKFPPTHVLIASYFGFGKETEKTSNEDEIAQLLTMIPERT